jgi:hypothetical protein
MGIQNKCQIIKVNSDKREEIQYQGTEDVCEAKIVFIGSKQNQVELTTEDKHTYVYKIK